MSDGVMDVLVTGLSFVIFLFAITFFFWIMKSLYGLGFVICLSAIKFLFWIIKFPFWIIKSLFGSTHTPNRSDKPNPWNDDAPPRTSSSRKKMNTPNSTTDDGEALIGIDPNWSKDKKLNHLRAEFVKWNGRLNTITDPEKRKKAQKMLDTTARLRVKYK